MVEAQVEREQRLQVLDQHGARHVGLVGEEPQRVVGQQIGLPDADRRKALRLLGVPHVHRDLPVEVQQRLGLHVDPYGRVVPVGVRVHPREEEAPERIAGRLAPPAAGVVEHPVELLRRAVVPGVAGVTELVGVAVQGPRRRQCLVRPAPVHEIHQVRFDPLPDDSGVLAEAREHLRILRVLTREVFHRELVPARGPARSVAAEAQPGKQHGQHPIHVDRLEVDVRELLQAELAVAAPDRHQPASPVSASSARTPSSPRLIRK